MAKINRAVVADQCMERIETAIIQEFDTDFDTTFLKIEQEEDFDQLVKLILFLRDEARFTKRKDVLYAHCVAGILNDCVYPWVKKVFEKHWDKLWSTIADREANNPLPRQAFLAKKFQKADTSNTGMTAKGDIVIINEVK